MIVVKNPLLGILLEGDYIFRREKFDYCLATNCLNSSIDLS